MPRRGAQRPTVPTQFPCPAACPAPARRSEFEDELHCLFNDDNADKLILRIRCVCVFMGGQGAGGQAKAPRLLRGPRARAGTPKLQRGREGLGTQHG